MNEFSLVSRVLGSLYYRHPEESVLQPLLTLINQGKLNADWPFEQDDLIDRLQRSCQPAEMIKDYNGLFMGDQPAVSPFRSDYVADNEQACRAFLQQSGMRIGDGRSDHFGLLLLAISWIEDNAPQADKNSLQIILFDDYLFPWCGKFLGKVEAHSQSAFYRTLTMISREALQGMRDELAEERELDSDS